ncbi:MAG: vanadium-dependent haloperoxidase [Planctomycetota bacterium]
MRLPFSDPDPAGSERARIAKKQRDLATEIARLQPQALTRTNAEEVDHAGPYPANFTKGLLHDKNGLLKHDGQGDTPEDREDDYACFVEAINSPNPSLFEKSVETAETRGCGKFRCTAKDNKTVAWRGWESPRCGHVYELQGLDAGAVGMAPAPRVGSSELAAEMAEVYGLAILRDVPFTRISEGGGDQLCASSKKPSQAVLTAKEIVDELNKMPFFSTSKSTSSTPMNADDSGLNHFERNRRFARNQSLTDKLKPRTVFRGSTPGSLVGPYISQFMLIGASSRDGEGKGSASFPGLSSSFDLQDGFIPYGTLIIDQRTITHRNCLDHMTDWCSWLDVQNGANFGGLDVYESRRRFITTPRDLATYVHFDALYEAYLNACLIMLAMEVPRSRGFPEPSRTGRRTPFATFGGPHILSLVTEVATRCLKAVRRQKFNYHRRARPEAIGGRLTLCNLDLGNRLGLAEAAFTATLKEIPKVLRKAVIDHNVRQNKSAKNEMRKLSCKSNCLPTNVDAATFAKSNLLLPMAFPEGSPMHPAYGAGHATVAGGCVTMLKAFFEMFEDSNSSVERKLTADGAPIAYVPNKDGSKLVKDPKTKDPLTIQGELDKLAANISIGRNMAGVHYYSDYYDSLRMGERVAVGILLQQAPTYGDTVETTFTSFDGDLISISGEAASCPSISIIDRNGNPVLPAHWWLRHVVGEEIIEDF